MSTTSWLIWAAVHFLLPMRTMRPNPVSRDWFRDQAENYLIDSLHRQGRCLIRANGWKRHLGPFQPSVGPTRRKTGNLTALLRLLSPHETLPPRTWNRSCGMLGI